LKCGKPESTIGKAQSRLRPSVQAGPREDPESAEFVNPVEMEYLRKSLSRKSLSRKSLSRTSLSRKFSLRGTESSDLAKALKHEQARLEEEKVQAAPERTYYQDEGRSLEEKLRARARTSVRKSGVWSATEFKREAINW